MYDKLNIIAIKQSGHQIGWCRHGDDTGMAVAMVMVMVLAQAW